MLARTHVEGVANEGLAGDCHARPLGPRQVLVVRQEDLDEVGLAAWQVRANLAIHGLPVSALSSGGVLHVGETLRLRVTHACEICKVLRRYVPDETLTNLPGRRGSLAVILNGGRIALGDPVVLGPDRFPRIPERFSDRVVWVVARIPPGRVMTYDVLLQVVGASGSHARALPRCLGRAHVAGLPAHRVLTSNRQLTGHIAGQRDALDAEGVRLDAAGRLLDDSGLWDGQRLYARRRC